MIDSSMLEVDTRRLFEDLRALLYERFRGAFLRRERREDSPTPNAAIESVTRHFLLERPETRAGVQKIIGRHVGEDALHGPQGRYGPRGHHVYTPEMVKKMAFSIGREAWRRRYEGPLQVELKVQSSRVSLHQIRPP